jgi:hypothetical protein
MIKIPTHELAPEIDRCPCCGMMVCDRHPATGARERRNVQAEACCVHGGDGRLTEATLVWRCLSCQCPWIHGQFAEPDIDISNCQECGEFRTHGHVCKVQR